MKLQESDKFEEANLMTSLHVGKIQAIKCRRQNRVEPEADENTEGGVYER